MDILPSDLTLQHSHTFNDSIPFVAPINILTLVHVEFNVSIGTLSFEFSNSTDFVSEMQILKDVSPVCPQVEEMCAFCRVLLWSLTHPQNMSSCSKRSAQYTQSNNFLANNKALKLGVHISWSGKTRRHTSTSCSTN